MTPEPWEPGYKPPTAREAFAKDAPLPRSALDTLDYINRKDEALQAAESLAHDLARELERIADVSDDSGARGYHRLCADHALAKSRRATGLERPPA